MKFLANIIKRMLPKEIPKPVGRWNVENCNTRINNKVDWSNEDHCGPCGQYKLKQTGNEVNEVNKVNEVNETTDKTTDKTLATRK